MLATAGAREMEARFEDSYLGFGIRFLDNIFFATPVGWTGEVLLAESMPILRRKIWRWWYQVQ